jgi:signal transduction histidine kinase
VTHRDVGAVSDAGSGERPQDVVGRLQDEIARLRRSRRRLVQAADADRRAIERTIHDRLLQNLVALAVDLRRLAGLVEAEPAAAKALADEMAANLREALTETTALAQQIHPPLLDRRGFVTSLRSAAEYAGVTILIDVPAGADYAPEISATLYWSCAQALSFAAPGSQVTVSVREGEDSLTFDVAVVGHDAAERLDGLRDRLEALDGRLSVDVDDLGTRVQGWLPLSR